MTFGERLRAARKAKKLTQKELASLIHAAHNSISNWENDQNKPDPDTIQNLCWALDVTPNYFFLDETPASTEATRQGSLPSGCFSIKMNQIPLVGSIACGTPILATENIEDHVDIPEHIRADFALRCKGDSMLGTKVQIHDGDIVYIRQQNDVDNGAIAAVLIDDEATLKRVYKKPGKLILQPENPDYEPLVYIGQELNEIRILGKAVAYTVEI